MEYESNEAKKLIKLLETSEEQEKEYWLRRTKIAIFSWLSVFAIAILAMVFVMLGVSESGRYVSFRLYYLKNEVDENGNEITQTAYENRKATIYETISNIMPPADIKGYTFNGKYYNSSNMEVVIDPSSNIANALTYESVIYMQYTLAHYKLTIRTDLAEIVEGDEATTKVFQTEDNAIGYHKKMYIVPSEQINGANFAKDYADYKNGKYNLAYINNNFLNLYAINYANVNTSLATPMLNDIDGRANYHISGFKYFYENKTYEYSFKAVDIIDQSDNDMGQTYLVIKTVTDRYGNVIERLGNFANGYKPNYIKSTSGDTQVIDEKNGKYVTTGEKVASDQANANVFFMPDTDLAVSIVWEADNRYLILVDTLDDYSWNRIFDNKNAAEVGNEYNLTYDTVKDYLANASTDGVTNDWDTLESDYSGYNIDWSKAIVLEGIANNTNVIRFINNNGVANSSTDTLIKNADGDYYYPYYKYGYQLDSSRKWEIYTKSSTGGEWSSVDLNTTITSGYASNCILVRPNWRAISYEYRFGLDGGVANIPSGTSFGSFVGYDRSNGLKLNKKVTEGNKLPWGEVNSEYMFVTKRGYTFVGWEVDCNLMFNYTNLRSENADGTNAADSYIDIIKETDEKNVLVYNPSFLLRGTSYEAIDNGELQYIRANNTIAEDKAQLWYRSENINDVVYNFYYFGTKSDLEAGKPSDMRLPQGYFIENSSQGDIVAVWDIIDYHIDLQLSKDQLNNDLESSELKISTISTSTGSDVSTTTFGYGVVYGLKNYNSAYEDIIYVGNTDSTQYENQVVINKNSGKANLFIKYNIDDMILLPTSNQLYRRGYDLLGYDIYESGTLVNQPRFSDIKTTIVINGSGTLPNNYLNINRLAGSITILPVWNAQTYTISYKGSTNNQQNVQTIVNYNSASTDEQKEKTHSVILNNAEANDYTITDQCGSGKTYVFDKAANNVIQYNSNTTGTGINNNDTVVRNYIKLNDWYSNSQFDIRLQFSRNNGFTKTVDLFSSHFNENNYSLGMVDMPQGQDYALFDVLDDSSYHWLTTQGWTDTYDLSGKVEAYGNLLNMSRPSYWTVPAGVNQTRFGSNAINYSVSGSSTGTNRQWITYNSYYSADDNYTIVSQVLNDNITNNYIGIELFDKDYNNITRDIAAKTAVLDQFINRCADVIGCQYAGWENGKLSFRSISNNQMALRIKDLATLIYDQNINVAYFKISTAMSTTANSADGEVRLFLQRGLLNYNLDNNGQIIISDDKNNVGYYLNTINNYPAYTAPIYSLQTYTDAEGLERKRYVFETTIYEGNNGGCYSDQLFTQLPLAKVRVYKEYINNELYYCIEFLGLTADVNYSIQDINRDVVEMRMLTNPSALTNPNSKLDVWMNDATKDNFVADEWYLIYNYEQLKAIIEYNQTHVNKIYYVLLTSSTGAYYIVYDVLNLINPLDESDPGLRGGILRKGDGNTPTYTPIGSDTAVTTRLTYIGEYAGYYPNAGGAAASGTIKNCIRYTNAIGSDFYFGREDADSTVQEENKVCIYVEPLITLNYYAKQVVYIDYCDRDVSGWSFIRPYGPYNEQGQAIVASQMYYDEMTRDDDLYKNYYIPAEAIGNGKTYTGIPDVANFKSVYGDFGNKTTGWVQRYISNVLYQDSLDKKDVVSSRMTYYHHNRFIYSSDGSIRKNNQTAYQQQYVPRYTMLDVDGSGVYYTLKGMQYSASIAFNQAYNVWLDGVQEMINSSIFSFYKAAEINAGLGDVTYTLDTSKYSELQFNENNKGMMSYIADGSSKFYTSVNLPLTTKNLKVSVGGTLSNNYSTAEVNDVKFSFVMGSGNNTQTVDLSGYNNYSHTSNYGEYINSYYRPVPTSYSGVAGKEDTDKIYLPYNYSSTTVIGKGNSNFEAIATGSDLRGYIGGTYTFDTLSRTALTFRIDFSGKYADSTIMKGFDIDISDELQSTKPDEYTTNLANYHAKLNSLQELLDVKVKSGDIEYSSADSRYNCGIRFYNQEGKPANARIVMIDGVAYIQVFLGWLIAADRTSTVLSDITNIAIYLNEDKLNSEVNHYNLSINKYVTNYNITNNSTISTNGFSLDLKGQNNDVYPGTYTFNSNLTVTNGKLDIMLNAIAHGGKYRFVLTLNADYNESIPAAYITMGNDSKLIAAGVGEVVVNSTATVSLTADSSDSNKYYLDITGVNGHTTIDFRRIVKNSNTLTIYGTANQGSAATTDITKNLIEGNEITGLGDTFLYQLNAGSSNVITATADFREEYLSIYNSNIEDDFGASGFNNKLANAFVSHLINNKATNEDILKKLFSDDSYIVQLSYRYNDNISKTAYFVTYGNLQLGLIENNELNNAKITTRATSGAYNKDSNTGYELQNGDYELSGDTTYIQGFKTATSTYNITINTSINDNSFNLANYDTINIFIDKPAIEIYSRTNSKGEFSHSPINVKDKLGDDYTVKHFTAKDYTNNLSSMVVNANNNNGIPDLVSAINGNGTAISLENNYYDGSIYYGSYLVVKAVAQTGYDQNAKLIFKGFNTDGTDLEFAIGSAKYKENSTEYAAPYKVGDNIFWYNGYYYYIICLKPTTTGSAEARDLGATLNFEVSVPLNIYNIEAQGGLSAEDVYSITVTGSNNTANTKYNGYTFEGVDNKGDKVDDLSNNLSSVVKYRISHDDNVTITFKLAPAYTNSPFTLQLVNSTTQSLYTLTRNGDKVNIVDPNNNNTEVSITDNSFSITISNIATNIKLVGYKNDVITDIADALTSNTNNVSETKYGTSTEPTAAVYGSTNEVEFGYKEYYEQKGAKLTINGVELTIGGITKLGAATPTIACTGTSSISGLGIVIDGKIYVWNGSNGYSYIDQWGNIITTYTGTHSWDEGNCNYIFSYTDQGGQPATANLFSINYDPTTAIFTLNLNCVVGAIVTTVEGVDVNEYDITVLNSGEITTSVDNAKVTYNSSSVLTVTIPTTLGLDENGASVGISATKWNNTTDSLIITGLFNNTTIDLSDVKIKKDGIVYTIGDSGLFEYTVDETTQYLTTISVSGKVDGSNIVYTITLGHIVSDIVYTIGGVGKYHTLTFEYSEPKNEIGDIEITAAYTHFKINDETTENINNQSIDLSTTNAIIKEIAHNEPITLNITLTNGAIIDLTGKAIGSTIDLGNNNVLELVTSIDSLDKGNIGLVVAEGNTIIYDTTVTLIYANGINADNTLNLNKIISSKQFSGTVSSNLDDAISGSSSWTTGWYDNAVEQTYTISQKYINSTINAVVSTAEYNNSIYNVIYSNLEILFSGLRSFIKAIVLYHIYFIIAINSSS